MKENKKVFQKDAYRLTVSATDVSIGGDVPKRTSLNRLWSWAPDVTTRGRGRVGPCNEIQCIMGNGHMGTHSVNRQTKVKTLPSRTFVGGW